VFRVDNGLDVHDREPLKKGDPDPPVVHVDVWRQLSRVVPTILENVMASTPASGSGGGDDDAPSVVIGTRVVAENLNPLAGRDDPSYNSTHQVFVTASP